jgi:hypothetical protein
MAVLDVFVPVFGSALRLDGLNRGPIAVKEAGVR